MSYLRGYTESREAHFQYDCKAWINGITFSETLNVLVVSTVKNIWVFGFNSSDASSPLLYSVDCRLSRVGKVSRGLDSNITFVLDEKSKEINGWYIGCTISIQGQSRSIVEYNGRNRAVTLDQELPRTVKARDEYKIHNEEAFFQVSDCALSLTYSAHC